MTEKELFLKILTHLCYKSKPEDQLIEKALYIACGVEEINYHTDIQPLASIFDDGSTNSWFMVNPLDSSGNLMPTQKKQGFTLNVKDVLSKISDSNNYLALAQYYFSNVSSSIKGLEDVSLFDLAKSVAGIYNCIKVNRQEFYMIAVDLTGIQKFIYSITSRKAAQSLKGRSFYLSMVSEDLMLQCFDYFGLNKTSLVYSSGGKFFVLLPAQEGAMGKITEYKKISYKAFNKVHQGELGLAIAYHQVDCESGVVWKNVWSSIFSALSESKKRRFVDTAIDEYEKFFEPIELGGIAKTDAVTGNEILGKPVLIDNLTLSELSALQIDLGKKLADASYYVISKQKLKIDNDIHPESSLSGRYHYFLNKSDYEKAQNELLNTKDCIVMKFNEFDKDGKLGAYFYAGTRNGTGDFKELAEMGIGSAKLGILRMDVDNLGLFFSDFITKKGPLPARYSTASNYLDLYFRWRLAELTNREEYKGKILTVYAGGDDLFLVAQWEFLFRFASELREDFRKFVCNSTLLSISAGMAVVSPAFPIKKSAELAADAEHQAKTYTLNGVCPKDAIHLLGATVRWGNEMRLLNNYEQKWVKLFAKNAGKGLLYKLFEFKEMRSGGQIKWRWQAVYHLAQLSGRISDKDKNKEKELREIIETFKMDLFDTNQPKNLELICLAGAIVDLKNRNKN